MRSRRYLVSVLGTVAVAAAGAGAATAATGSKTTTPSKPAAPQSHSGRRYAPNMNGHCPHMGAGHASGAVGPASSSYGRI